MFIVKWLVFSLPQTFGKYFQAILYCIQTICTALWYAMYQQISFFLILKSVFYPNNVCYKSILELLAKKVLSVSIMSWTLIMFVCQTEMVNGP